MGNRSIVVPEKGVTGKQVPVGLKTIIMGMPYEVYADNGREVDCQGHVYWCYDICG